MHDAVNIVLGCKEQFNLIEHVIDIPYRVCCIHGRTSLTC